MPTLTCKVTQEQLDFIDERARLRNMKRSVYLRAALGLPPNDNTSVGEASFSKRVVEFLMRENDGKKK